MFVLYFRRFQMMSWFAKISTDELGRIKAATCILYPDEYANMNVDLVFTNIQCEISKLFQD